MENLPKIYLQVINNVTRAKIINCNIWMTLGCSKSGRKGGQVSAAASRLIAYRERNKGKKMKKKAKGKEEKSQRRARNACAGVGEL